MGNGFLTTKAIPAGEEMDMSLKSYGTSYCVACLCGLISGLRVPLPIGNDMQTFMSLPHVLQIRDLQMVSGVQWSEREWDS